MSTTFAKRSYADQLAQQLGELIHGGQWQPGSRLPAVRALAERYEVSTRTVLQAIQELEKQKLVVRKPSGRVHVLAPPAGAHGADTERPNAAVRPTSSPGLMHVALVGIPTIDHTTTLRDDWHHHIAAAIEQELGQFDGACSTRISAPLPLPRENTQRVIEQIERLAGQLQGLVLFPRHEDQLQLIMNAADRLNLPWVSIARPENLIHNFVVTNNLASGRIAGRCFLAKGFERVVVLGAKLHLFHSWPQKVLGIYDAFIQAGRNPRGVDYLDCENLGVQAGLQAMDAYLDRHPAPQAIFGISDPMCLGAMQACQKRGVAIPEETAVLGSTDLALAAMTVPAMSVVGQPMDAIGRTAVHMLVRMIQTGERRLPGQLLESPLILRDSFTLTEAERDTLARQGIVPVAAPAWAGAPAL